MKAYFIQMVKFLTSDFQEASITEIKEIFFCKCMKTWDEDEGLEISGAERYLACVSSRDWLGPDRWLSGKSTDCSSEGPEFKS